MSYFASQKNTNLIHVVNFTTAALSKSIANIICSPINVLKTRYEVVGNKNP